jgi:hypothetical protein
MQLQGLAHEGKAGAPTTSVDNGLFLSMFPNENEPHTTNRAGEGCETEQLLQLKSSAPSDRTNDPPPTQPTHDAEVWRRPPKRWGLADWSGDDGVARERRREQNRLSQRRFREKRHRRDAPPTAGTEARILSGWAAALVAGGGGEGVAAPRSF